MYMLKMYVSTSIYSIMHWVNYKHNKMLNTIQHRASSTTKTN